MIECHECGSVASSIEEHEMGCDAAERIINRHIDRLEDNLGTVWETEKTEAKIIEYKNLLKEYE